MLGAFALAVVAYQQPQFNEAELKALPELRKVGGSLDWVNERDQWQLCLDVELSNRIIDFRTVAPLKRLSVLRVFQGQIKEESLRRLKGLPKLELLVIHSFGLTNKGMAHISGITNLTKLDVKGETISATGLTHLKKLSGLKRLFLYNTTVKDKDLFALEPLQNLSELCLPKSVTTNGLAALQRKMPRTRLSQL